MLFSRKYFSGMMIVMLCFLTACGQNPEENEPKKTEETIDGPVYTVASITNFPPFVMRDKKGDPMGFDIDILRAIARNQGFNVDFSSTIWYGIFDNLYDDSAQIVSSALVIRPDREALVDFSDPYIRSGRIAVVKSELADKTFADLNNNVFVTQEKTTNIPLLTEFTGDSKKVKTVETPFLELKAVISGDADAAFDDARSLRYLIGTLPEEEQERLHVIPNFDYPADVMGFAVKKGNHELRDTINQGLANIKEDGSYERIYQKWFGEDSNEYGFPMGAIPPADEDDATDVSLADDTKATDSDDADARKK